LAVCGQCRFYYDMTKNKRYMDLYAKCEDVDGYFRDGCVFREDIDIFDNMQAIVKYSNGATMTYSLNAYMPYEGYRVAFNGEKGRVDVRSYERQPWDQPESYEVYITKSFGKRTKVPMPKLLEGHGGGDDRMRDLIFRKTDVPEYMRLPDSRAGAMSCLIGIAIRNSIDQKRPIKIADLIRL
jgi:predicted dehydrogenase